MCSEKKRKKKEKKKKLSVLGFVPAGIVSSSPTLQFYGDAIKPHKMASFPVSLSARSFPLTPIWKSERNIDPCQCGPRIPRLHFCSQVMDSTMKMPCAAWWMPSLQAIQGKTGVTYCFRHHCQAGGWDLTGATVCVDGGRPLLDGETPLWPVFCDWAIGVQYGSPKFDVFLNENIQWAQHKTACKSCIALACLVSCSVNQTLQALIHSQIKTQRPWIVDKCSFNLVMNTEQNWTKQQS